ncbi:MAG TPA: dTMP kinase [Patescibacteria group bacterium]
MKHNISFDLEFRKNPYPGKLIVIEGMDGAGKTTQAKELVKMLNKSGYNASYTKEPTDQIVGQFIREKILSGNLKIDPLALQYLFNADRVMHMTKIESLLEKGMIIVMDRYFWSSVAYALADLGGVKEWYLTAFSVLSFYHQFIVPDISIYLDVDIEIALRRIEKSGKHGEIYDNDKKLPLIAKNYRQLLKEFPEMFEVVDANGKAVEITPVLFDLVKKLADKK